MGSRSNLWVQPCSRCHRRIDPLGVDDYDVGHVCGLCCVEHERTSSFSRLGRLSRAPFLQVEILWSVAECLGGNRASFRRALQRHLLRLNLEGKPYGFRPCTLKLRNSILCGSNTEDTLDVVLDFVYGVGRGEPDLVEEQVTLQQGRASWRKKAKDAKQRQEIARQQEGKGTAAG